MRVTSKGHYGLMAIAELALHEGEGAVPLKAIAERQGLSEHYLEQLFAPLRRAGLVRSVRGAQGGYLLARDAGEITVGDVLRALEGSLAPLECAADVDLASLVHCTNPLHCLVRDVWQRLHRAVEEVADSITLADIVQQVREARRRQGIMFYI